MSFERNEPCPCGSGKKYKKCCGKEPVQSDPVALNRVAAYAGETGRRRRQFCLDYAAFKKSAIAQGNELLQKRVADAGEIVSCKKGCSNCCILYVIATLQEAECIVYYLYQHEAELQHFTRAYRAWKQGLGLFEHRLERIDRMIARNIAGKLSAGEQEQFNSDINAYTARNVFCPFLIDHACSIYEVRPFVCAGLVAVTPPDWCTWDGSGTSQAKYHKIELKLDEEMPYFIRTRSPILFGSMPELVHHLLEKGYSFLAGIEGLEELRHAIH